MRTGTKVARNTAAPATTPAAPIPAAQHHDEAPAPDVAAQLGAAAQGHSFAGLGVSAAPPGVVQPKLTVGAPDDQYEDEADRVAAQVMRMPDPAAQRAAAPEDEDELVQTRPDAQRAAAPEEDELLQAKPAIQRAADGSFDAGPDVTARIAARRGAGSPLPEAARQFMEPRFGADFSGVRVHTDGEADQISQELSARAFTTGGDIYFRQGQYSPTSAPGQELLAHELTHVVQQRAPRGSAATALGGAKATAQAASPLAQRKVSSVELDQPGPDNGPSLRKRLQNLQERIARLTEGEFKDHIQALKDQFNAAVTHIKAEESTVQTLTAMIVEVERMVADYEDTFRRYADDMKLIEDILIGTDIAEPTRSQFRERLPNVRQAMMGKDYATFKKDLGGSYSELGKLREKVLQSSKYARAKREDDERKREEAERKREAERKERAEERRKREERRAEEERVRALGAQVAVAVDHFWWRVLSSLSPVELVALRRLSRTHRQMADQIIWQLLRVAGLSSYIPNWRNDKTMERQLFQLIDDTATRIKIAADQVDLREVIYLLNNNPDLKRIVQINYGQSVKGDPEGIDPGQVRERHGPSSKLSSKMHNKFIVQGQDKVITGSPNMTHAGLTKNTESAIYIVNPLVAAYFNHYFNLISKGVRPHYDQGIEFSKALTAFNQEHHAIRMAMAPFIDIRDFVKAELAGADTVVVRMFIISLYGDDNVIDALCAMADAGARVTVVVDAGQYHGKKDDAEEEVEEDTYVKEAADKLASNKVSVILQSSPAGGIMHDKLILAHAPATETTSERHTVIVGSSGFTKNVYEGWNYENMIAVDSQALYNYFMQHHVASTKQKNSAPLALASSTETDEL